ncbi:MAG: hypothetical protein H0X36_04000 [Sphingomonadaceae bacterium]|nr:hypothetical protein [Sphingomonadaceae bacterium]
MIALALLLAVAAQGAGVGVATPVDPLDQVRCVREEVIGSLAQTRKICHTQREWEKIRANGNVEARRMIQDGQRTVGPEG